MDTDQVKIKYIGKLYNLPDEGEILATWPNGDILAEFPIDNGVGGRFILRPDEVDVVKEGG